MIDREEKIPSVRVTDDHVKVTFGDLVLAESDNPLLVREYGLPPVYYIPEADIKLEYLEPSDRQTHCPWKGDAVYYHITVNGKKVQNAAWKYPEPRKRFEAGRGYVAFYTGKMDACYLNGKRVVTGGSAGFTGWVIDDLESV